MIRMFAILSTVTVLGYGCASTVQYVPFPDQAQQIEDSNKARIYVVRPTVFGGSVRMEISDGSSVIGKTGPKGYLCWERTPGDIEIVGKAENEARLAMRVEKGMVYYIQQNVRMGILFARNKLSQLTQDEGEEELKKCKPPKQY